MVAVVGADQPSVQPQNAKGVVGSGNNTTGPENGQMHAPPADLDRKGDRDMRSPNGTPGQQDGHPDFSNNTEFRDRMLKDFESKGVDVSALKAAIESGDRDKIRVEMDTIRDKLPAGTFNQTPGRDGPMDRDMMNNTPRDKPMGEGPGKSKPDTGVQSSQQSKPTATPTKSPLSPLTILTALGIAGMAVVTLQRR